MTDKAAGSTITVRMAEASELRAYMSTIRLALLRPPPSEAQVIRSETAPHAVRSHAAFEGDRLVGTAGAFDMALTVPGGAAIGAAGVTRVGVLPTHTRRGILTSLMRAQLADVRERGEPVAVLGASESIIYGRFGYGLATTGMNLSIETVHGAYREPMEPCHHLDVIEGKEVLSILPALYERIGRGHPGNLSRPDPWWDFVLNPVAGDWRADVTPVHVVHRDARGEPDGYATYSLPPDHSWEESGSPVELFDLQAADHHAYAALWRYLLDIDLVDRVKAPLRLADEPLRWMLADPRKLEAKSEDHLWLRIVDMEGTLAARRYRRAGELVLDVSDRFIPDLAGRYQLAVDDNGHAGCERTSARADVALSVADLGALYLGGVSFAVLAAAGRVTEQRPGALALADAMFGWDRAPWCGTFF